MRNPHRKRECWDSDMDTLERLEAAGVTTLREVGAAMGLSTTAVSNTRIRLRARQMAAGVVPVEINRGAAQAAGAAAAVVRRRKNKMMMDYPDKPRDLCKCSDKWGCGLALDEADREEIEMMRESMGFCRSESIFDIGGAVHK